MEATVRYNWLRWGKALIPLFLGLFVMANAKAGLLAPSLSVLPTATSVQNGDTVTISVQSSVTVGVLTSVTCQFNGGALPANVSFTEVGGGSLLDLGGSVNATLTITNVSSTSAGTYTFSSSTVGLLGGLLTTTASSTVSIPPSVVGLAQQSQMVQKGFKIQFSAPTGSNLVIQVSSDMRNWTSIYTNKVLNGSLTYTDAVAKTVSGRFYRAKLK